ncbi:MAG TPA: reverse transcriptase domain-containing protein [Ktedonobacteraceae bacterium]|nr:reverse transcriptase domain-containing protein [Ktedonobacteraceae bacterium]
MGRIIQEIVRMVIEPLLEAQFFSHSYGFRPMRDATHALARVPFILWQAKCTYAVEGDIRAFFDHVNHNILLKKLWKMGIRDKRLLMLIKKMLKVGILHEIEANDLGTPQGGIISPLLANVYLPDFDEYIALQWEKHPKQAHYAQKRYAINNMGQQGYPRYYLIRYADDWVILTHSLENAIRIKELAKQFLARNGRLELSEDKTLITDTKKAYLTFLGTETRVRLSRKGKGFVTYSRPSKKALNAATKTLRKQVKRIERAPCQDQLIQEMLRYNSIAIGIGNSWSMTSAVCKCGSRVDHRLWYKQEKVFKKITGTKGGEYHKRRIPAEKTSNLPVRHAGHRTRVHFVEYEPCSIGLTLLSFSTFEPPRQKNPQETPYSKQGRGLWEKRTEKRLRLMRPDALTLLDDLILRTIGRKQGSPAQEKRNLEYSMNRGYALNRDHCQCKICATSLVRENLETHHKNPFLPLDQINKVSNLASLCTRCHDLVHNNQPNPFGKRTKPFTKLEKYRQTVKSVS